MNIKHEWTKIEGGYQELKSQMIIKSASKILIESLRLPDTVREYEENQHEREIADFLYGPIQVEIEELCRLFRHDTDAQTLYDKMREIAAMCRNPTWLERDDGHPT